MMPIERVKFHLKPLVDQILDQLPPHVFTSDSTTFLDPAFAGGQFLREVVTRLRACGHSDDNIRSRIYGCEITNFRVKYARQLGGVISDNLIKADFLSHDWGTMKFDVILGNPPYQESNNTGGNLWLKFVDKCVRYLSKPETHLAFVTPPTFIGRDKSVNGRSDYSVYLDMHIQTLCFLDKSQANQFFPGIGSRFCWYVAQCNPVIKQSTLIKQGAYEVLVDLNQPYPLPDQIDELSMTIHKKLVNSANLKFEQTREIKYYGLKQHDQVRDSKERGYPYKSYFSHNLVRYTNIKASHYEYLKVMIPQTSTVDKSFVDKNCNISEDLFYQVVNSQTEADDLIKYLNTDLVKYICKNYRGGRAMGQALKSGIIPKPGAKLKLTKHEIKYIKENAS